MIYPSNTSTHTHTHTLKERRKKNRKIESYHCMNAHTHYIRIYIYIYIYIKQPFEQFNFGYSAKNIPICSEKQYIKALINKTKLKNSLRTFVGEHSFS